MTATCAMCGSEHDEEALELSYRRPDAVADMPADKRLRSVFENDDVCVVDGERFFIRTTLPIPVNGCAEGYRIGVWVEVAEAVFERVGELWTDPAQAIEPPAAASLANEVRHHPGSLGLGLLLQLTGPKTRPQVFVSDATHPLGIEQRRGITPHRASQYSSGLRRGPESGSFAALRQRPAGPPQ